MDASWKAELAGRLRGRVYSGEDPGYAPELAGFNTAVVHGPDLVAAAESAADVAEAVRFARGHGLRVSVQATGHGEATHIRSGLLISTHRLDGVAIDAAARLATIGGGARWAAVITGAAPHGLAPITGSSPTVGVSGYLLGGGLGPLARSHGFSSDYLVGLTVVTGTGELVEASASSHPDLFWALRGGKGGLGVVTDLRLRLAEIPALYAGALFFAEEQIEAVLRGWVAWSEQADPRVTTSVALVRFPPLPHLPPPLRGRHLLSLRFAYPGPVEQGERLAAPLRALAPVHLDGVGPLPLAEVARIHSDPVDPAPSWARGLLLDRVDQQLATALLEHVGPGQTTPFLAVEIRHLGEATTRDVPEGSAVGGRRARFTLGLVGVNPEHFAAVLPAATDRLVTDLQPWICPETNINFAGSPGTPELFARAWPPHVFQRLAEVRRRYDPDAVFAYGPGRWPHGS